VEQVAAAAEAADANTTAQMKPAQAQPALNVGPETETGAETGSDPLAAVPAGKIKKKAGGFAAMLGGGGANPAVSTGWKPSQTPTSTDWGDLLKEQEKHKAAEAKEEALADERRWVAQQASKLAAAIATCAAQAAAGAAVEAAINCSHHPGAVLGVRKMPWTCRHLAAKRRVSKTAEQLEAERRAQALDPLLHSLAPTHLFLRALQRPTELPHPAGHIRCDCVNRQALVACSQCDALRMGPAAEASRERQYAADLETHQQLWEEREAARRARIAQQQAVSTRARKRWLHALRMVRKGVIVNHPPRLKDREAVSRKAEMDRARAAEEAMRRRPSQLAREAAIRAEGELAERRMREKEAREAAEVEKLSGELHGRHTSSGAWVYGKKRDPSKAKKKEPNTARDILGPLPRAANRPESEPESALVGPVKAAKKAAAAGGGDNPAALPSPGVSSAGVSSAGASKAPAVEAAVGRLLPPDAKANRRGGLDSVDYDIDADDEN
jgi:hypothetical protein